MIRDLARVLDLWRDRGLWLLAGMATAIAAALAGLALRGLAGLGTAEGVRRFDRG